MSPSPPIGLKELPPSGYLGIDFGTSTTHIAVCYVDGNVVPQPVPLAGKASVMTCLLWKEPYRTKPNEDGEFEDVVAYGEKAMRVWSGMNAENRAHHRFAATFKPDIAHGERAAQAQADARAFLRKCYKAVREGGMVRGVGYHEGMPVVIGIPAEIGNEQKELTARLARDAGFGEAMAVEEPLGALAFHLADGSVTAAEARRGVVVVDFGGGTLDVAWLDARHGLRTPWGDPTLGGRLFDDLFYQWLMEQNPGLTLDERDRLYVWQASCRELKERFSEHWEQDGEESEFLDALMLPGQNFARFAATPGQFRDRASRYTPSEVATKYFASVGGKLAELGKDGRVDLLGLIRRELVRGLVPGRRDIGRVILTGGSCKWPFMRDLAAEEFDVDRKLVLSSPQPETTIGSGLAVYHVLKYRNGKKRLKLREELPSYRAKFEEAVSGRVERFIHELTAAVVDPLMAQVESVYLNWYRYGGTLDDVQAKVLRLTQSYDVADRLRGQDALLAKDLVRLVRDHLRVWLKEHGIEREADEVVPEGSVLVPVPPLGSHAQDIAGIVTETVGGTLVGAVFILVYTTAHGAHILAHPLTGIPTALLSAIASAVGFSLIEDKLREAVMAINWNAVLLTPLRLRLSEQGLRDKIAVSRRAMSIQIADLLRQGHAGTAASSPAAGAGSPPKWQTLDQLQREVVAQFEQVVNQVIQDLGVLEEIRNVPR